MNISEIPIPSTSSEMIQTADDYYWTFYLEMVRMSNSKLAAHVEKYLQLIYQLSKSPSIQDMMRAATGCLALHRFGYRNFQILASVFDRTVPQTDPEYVAFTSYVASRLTHHPNLEQSRFVQHLLDRTLGWMRAHGRRARPLAAASMIEAVAMNAGNSISGFLPQFQSSIWLLVSHKSVDILQATAKTIRAFSMSILRYARSDLDSYLTFLTQLCIRLLSFGSLIRMYAALILLEQIILISPNFFLNHVMNLYSSISDVIEDSQPHVKSTAYATIACFSIVDKKLFVETIADDLFEMTPDLLKLYPEDIVRALGVMLENVPSWMITKQEELKKFVVDLLELKQKKRDFALQLLTHLLKTFGKDIIPINTKLIETLIELPLTNSYRECFVELSSIESAVPQEIANLIIKKVKSEMNNPTAAAAALMFIAELPANIFASDTNNIIDSITKKYRSDDVETRKQVAPAIYNISTICKPDEVDQIRLQMMQAAVNDNDPRARKSVLKVLEKHCTKDLGKPENMKFFQIYANDDSQRCREIAFKIIANLAKYNPLQISSITRCSMLDYFFTIRHIISIRQISRIIQTLPNLIAASSLTIKAYSAGLMEILMNILNKYTIKYNYENFLEKESETIILIRTVDSISLLAPLDPELVSLYADEMIPLLCDYLINTDIRLYQLSILNLFQTLYTAPASTLAYREKAPMILSVCSKLLASTISRNVRMAILKVVGLLGVMEVHQQQLPKKLSAPANVDPELARMFFHPSRDSDDPVDDILLLQSGSSVEQYYTSFCAQSLLDVFNDDSLHEYYPDAVEALVQVLEKPKMWALSMLDAFCSRMLTVLEESESNTEISILITSFTKLVSSSTHNTSPFLARALKFIRERFCDELRLEFLDLIIAFLQSIKDGLSPYASEIICLLMDNLENAHTSDADVCQRVLKAFSIIGLFANDLLYLVVPKICDTIECELTLEVVRIMSFDTLQALAKAADIMPCMGVLIRALTQGFDSSEPATRNASMNLVYVLIKGYGKLFLLNAAPLIDKINKNKMETLELKRLLAGVKDNNNETFKPVCDEKPKRQLVEPPLKLDFNADIITTRATAINMGAAKQLEKWLRSFIVTLIGSSTSPKIRACTQLASLYYPFARKLFKPAFYNCWTQLKKRNIAQITNAFRQLLNAKDSSETVVREIIDLIVFMDKIEMPLDLPVEDVIAACIKYGREAYALRLQQIVFEDNANAEGNIKNLIDIFVQLGNWPDAIGIWKRSLMVSSAFNKVEIMTKLRMWDQVEPMNRQIFNQTKGINSFIGLSQSLASMANWDKVMELYDTYTKLPSQHQCQCSQYFAEAAMHLGRWDVLDETLKVAPDDNERIGVIQAINELHKGNFDEATKIVNKCFSLLASRPITLWADNQQIHKNTMLIAQELMEVEELNRWIRTDDKRTIEDVWNERMKTAPRDFDIWFTLIANRIRITDIRESNIVNLFQMKSVTLGTKMHNNAFEVMFPDFQYDSAPDNHKLCAIVAKYVIGDKQKAIADMGKLSETISGPLSKQCHYFYANWLIENDDSTENLKIAYKHLKQVVVGNKAEQQSASEKRRRTRTFSNSSADFNSQPPSKSNIHRTYSSSDKGGLRLSAQVLRSLTTDISNVDSLRKWADVNTSLASINSTRTTKYVTNAIDALTQCTMIAPLFPDIVQLLNIFFEHADDPEVFNSTAHTCIEKLPPKLLLKASPQLLVQLSHNTPEVASFVHDILFQLLSDHYHDLIFSLIVMKFSKNLPRARAADKLLQQFHQIMPEQSDEVELIRKALLRAAVTWNEKVVQRIQDAFDHYSRGNHDRMIASLQSIISLTKKPKCEMHLQFKDKYADMLTQLEHILQLYNSNPKNAMQQLPAWCQKMQDDIGEIIKEIHMIQLSSISPQLNEKTHFHLAVPGTYRPGKPINQIKYFVGQFNVYMSKQQPKDVVVMGEDGDFYQYLLKGHEDLRLDERIMQFFRLINSLLKKETVFQSNLIEVMSVIPLSMSHGLVQWVRGTDTLRNVIEQYRTIHNLDPLEEYALLDEFSTNSFDLMEPIQKSQIIEKIFDIVPDTDIADFFWLKASSAEAWLKQINTFSISTAMTSIVGYIIGLGDRHPSNLLIDKFTGKVVHIDFGDCFERAATRPFLPEVVPFRLTRMMVKAMGPTGVDGLFRTSFVNMSNVLRDNKRVLVMVLAIFVHEPLIDPEADDDQPALPVGPGNLPQTPSMKYLSKAATGSIIDKGRVYMIDDAGVQSSLEMRNRVKQKLNGQDFDPKESLSVEDQATRLIKSATDIYSLGKMYSGWCPFW
ncbi:PIKK family atypical protein kinase [Tritrichomonas foetus]|uniref:Serine/threonine-protein kinase TOR n=1 Tax=Tritrichomonas foetus TaxID=1144522 RepID=A0A1J4JSS6_9EUKA|nr:PIKK family atypical protein kinase [Tritrichomonas foetus]|eukprot:OHT00556.1 PIKK family atypical protein kinase [Tritrichomonas foetus]